MSWTGEKPTRWPPHRARSTQKKQWRVSAPERFPAMACPQKATTTEKQGELLVVCLISKQGRLVLRSGYAERATAVRCLFLVIIQNSLREASTPKITNLEGGFSGFKILIHLFETCLNGRVLSGCCEPSSPQSIFIFKCPTNLDISLRQIPLRLRNAQLANPEPFSACKCRSSWQYVDRASLHNEFLYTLACIWCWN